MFKTNQAVIHKGHPATILNMIVDGNVKFFLIRYLKNGNQLWVKENELKSSITKLTASPKKSEVEDGVIRVKDCPYDIHERRRLLLNNLDLRGVLAILHRFGMTVVDCLTDCDGKLIKIKSQNDDALSLTENPKMIRMQFEKLSEKQNNLMLERTLDNYGFKGKEIKIDLNEEDDGESELLEI